MRRQQATCFDMEIPADIRSGRQQLSPAICFAQSIQPFLVDIVVYSMATTNDSWFPELLASL
jgi:hypothetical protein